MEGGRKRGGGGGVRVGEVGRRVERRDGGEEGWREGGRDGEGGKRMGEGEQGG